MNGVDVVILIVVGFSAVSGLRRGFVLGMVDLLVFGLALVAGARTSAMLAEPLRESGVPDPLAAGLAFFVAVVATYAVVGFAARVLLTPLVSLGSGTPLGWANGVLGLVPGAVRGLAIAAFIVMTLSMLPAEIGLRQRIAASRLAEPLAVTGQEALDAGLEWAGVDTGALGLSSRRLRSIREGLPFAGATDVHIDHDAQVRLLELINTDREAAGLSPLTADGDLAVVGREHAQEMFDLGYFSHTSPTTGGHEARMQNAGLDYLRSAENIALAPTADLAHEGLMNSPAYRTNILSPDFTYVGIAALRSVNHGLMVVQEFGG